MQFEITDETSNNSSFDIGSAIAKQITVKINNTDGELTKKNFSGAELSAKVGLEVNGTVEWLDKGTFYAEPGKDTGDTVTVSAFDKMLSFDQPYTKSKLAYPVTLREISVSEPGFSMVFPMNNWASFSLRFLMLFFVDI